MYNFEAQHLQGKPAQALLAFVHQLLQVLVQEFENKVQFFGMRNDIEQAAENSQLYCGRLNICNLTIWGCGSSFKMLISRMAVLGTPSSCHQTLKHFRS